MKTEFPILAFAMVLSLTGFEPFILPTFSQNDTHVIHVDVKTDKATYLPGELLLLQINIVNNSNVLISLPKETNVFDGSLKLSKPEELDN